MWVEEAIEAAPVAADGRVTYALTWTHPENWHQLETLQLRLTGPDGTVAWVSPTADATGPPLGVVSPTGTTRML